MRGLCSQRHDQRDRFVILRLVGVGVGIRIVRVHEKEVG
jgi:hypothetical protein